MAHDVFISHSSKDKAIADGICAHLEAAGIRCWIAPRDIAVGDDWPTAIANAIAQSRIMVLIFSTHSNSSAQISRELSLAADSNLVILPFKIDNVVPEPGKRYYLARTHWLDAMNPPTQAQINSLVERVGAILSSVGESRFAPKTPSSAPVPATTFPRRQERPRWLVGAIIGLVSVVVIGTLAGAFWMGSANSGLVAQNLPSETPTLASTTTVNSIPTSTATPSVTPTITSAPTPTVTLTPTNALTPIPTPTQSNYLVEEHFNGDSIDSSGWRVDCSSPNGSVPVSVTQANGFLSITGRCGLARRDGTRNATFIATEIQYVEVDMRVRKPPENFNLSPGEWVMGFVSLAASPDIFIVCQLDPTPKFRCGVGSEGHIWGDEFTPTIPLQYDTWYTSRIEIDPNTSEIRFFLDGKLIGQITPKDTNIIKSAQFEQFIGVAGDSNKENMFTCSFDNFVIRRR